MVEYKEMRREGMKPSQLVRFLSSVRDFDKPKILLEQYATNAEMAAEIVVYIDSVSPIDASTVIDMGCGCGMLSIAAAALGASYCLGVEIDPEAASICRENVCEMEVEEQVDIIIADALSLPLPSSSFDLVLMNPPFGTKHNPGMDVKFIERALSLVKEGGRVYSIHKSSTRSFIKKKGEELGAETKAVAQLRWPLSKTYRFHKKNAVDIDVDLVEFVKRK